MVLSSKREVAPPEAFASITDEDLVRRARRDDRWARGALYQRHAMPLGALLARLMGQRDGALDVVHDSFVYAFEHLDSLRDPSKFRSWIFQIGVNHARTRMRRQKLWRAIGFVSVDDASLESLCPRDANQEASAELRELDRTLRALPVDDRIAWMLRHVEGLSVPEVATSCGCSLSTAKRRIAAAERHLESKGASSTTEDR